MPNPTGFIRGSFRTKLFTVVTALILFVSVVLSLFFINHLRASQQDKLITEGRLMTRLLAHNMRLAVFAGNREQLSEVAAGAMETTGVLAVTVFDRNGAVLLHTSRSAGADVPEKGLPAGIREVSGRVEFYEPIVSRSGGGSDEAILLEEQQGETAATLGTVRVALDAESPRQRLNSLILTAALAVTGFLAVGTFCAFLVIRSVTLPLAHLAEGVCSVESGERDVEIPVESDDEIGKLAASFNRMAEALREREREQEEAAEKIRELNTRLEDKVRERTAQLEEANRELESFNYSASHDLRAPLLRLTGLCRAMEEDCGGRLDEEAFDFLRRIETVGRQMERVVSAMSSLFQVQRREMSIQAVDLSAVVRAVAALLREGEPEREVTVSAEPGVTVRGDMELLWVAMENLLGNAWKFTARTPGARIEFGVMKQEGETILFIRDNGAGFDMAYAGKLFEPFQRLHSPEDYPGTGVGLAIVHRIIARHGGRIWLESAEGRGTICYFTLPMESAPANGDKP